MPSQNGGMKKIAGGAGTADHAISVYGGIGQQQAAGSNSNVIQQNVNGGNLSLQQGGKGTKGTKGTIKKIGSFLSEMSNRIIEHPDERIKRRDKERSEKVDALLKRLYRTRKDDPEKKKKEEEERERREEQMKKQREERRKLLKDNEKRKEDESNRMNGRRQKFKGGKRKTGKRKTTKKGKRATLKKF